MELPSCALIEHRGTVRVRVVDICGSCGRPLVDYCNDGVTRNCRYCELYTRTRLNRKYCDCESGISVRRRSCKSSVVRRQYINVYATICVLLLASVFPNSMAAPTDLVERNNMDEASLWENPCDYSVKPTSIAYKASMAAGLAAQFKSIINNVSTFKDIFSIRLHSVASFSELMKRWEQRPWFRNLSFFIELLLPEGKTFTVPAPKQALDALKDDNKLDEVLPDMYMGLKMVVAVLHGIENDLTDDDVQDLKSKFKSTKLQTRYALCELYNYATARGLNVEKPLNTSEIPKYNDIISFLAFRDSAAYIEYLGEVFQEISRKE